MKLKTLASVEVPRHHSVSVVFTLRANGIHRGQ